MRARRAGVIALLFAAAALPASAEAAPSFTACVMVAKGGDCVKSTNVLYGSTVYLRGKISPVPDGRAKLLKKAPEGDTFKVLATVDISAKGVMHYTWKTSLGDAHWDRPNLLKFKVAGSGCSEVAKLLVIAGE